MIACALWEENTATATDMSGHAADHAKRIQNAAHPIPIPHTGSMKNTARLLQGMIRTTVQFINQTKKYGGLLRNALIDSTEVKFIYYRPFAKKTLLLTNKLEGLFAMSYLVPVDKFPLFSAIRKYDILLRRIDGITGFGFSIKIFILKINQKYKNQ